MMPNLSSGDDFRQNPEPGQQFRLVYQPVFVRVAPDGNVWPMTDEGPRPGTNVIKLFTAVIYEFSYFVIS
jgi:hypothetical protein